MKPSIQLRVSQQLTMTPQLQQAIRLLQLSSLELSAEISEALESNPLLESADAGLVAEPGAGEDGPDVNRVDGTETDGVERLERERVDWEVPIDAQPAAKGPAPEGSERAVDAAGAADEGLIDHLLWQLNLTPFNETEAVIAAAIVESVDDNGYLTDSLEALREGLGLTDSVELDEMEAVLHRVQRFDPVGVAARDLRECLLVQLSTLDPDTPHRSAAKRVVDGHLDRLARGERDKIRRELGVEPAALDDAIALVRSLDPRPGARIASGTPEYVRPDVYVTKRDGRWTVSLNPDSTPDLRINDYYAGLIKAANPEDASYLRGHLQEARWFLKSLETRNDTLLRVAQCIVEQQEAFFERGPEAMRPLVLRDVAEAVGMHESTISRVTTRKYLHCPRGVLELKYFFGSHVSTVDGGECSATAIQAMLKKLIAEEPAGKPLSDSKLAELLQGRGINVARRTVAKYREAQGIPSSAQRRRLA